MNMINLNPERSTAIRNMEKVREENFGSRILDSDKPVVVDFWATWCKPCHQLDRILEEISEEYENIDFYKVDVNESSRISSRYSVRSIPTLLFFNRGKLVDQAVGSISRGVVEEKLNEMTGNT